MRIRVFAPAKINLFLEVEAPGSDGMHPISSLAAFADVGDVVEARPADTLTLEVAGPFAHALNPEGDNLVIRAAHALAAFAGVAARAALKLEKNLPVASGIGGGSTDAAAALKALRILWSLSASDNNLHAVGGRLGADVPVCIEARTACMTGTGTSFLSVDAPPLSAVLVNPLRPLATGAVYRAYDAIGVFRPGARCTDVDLSDAKALIATLRSVGNDLAPAARALEPAIAEIEALLTAQPEARYVALSGSGATVFALTDDAGAARALAARVAAARPDWWVQPTVLGAVDASPRAL